MVRVWRSCLPGMERERVIFAGRSAQLPRMQLRNRDDGAVHPCSLLLAEELGR